MSEPEFGGKVTKPVKPRPELRRLVHLMTAEEFAGLLEVSEYTLYDWRKVNKGPRYVRLGGKIYYREKDVLDWIDHNLMRAPGETRDGNRQPEKRSERHVEEAAAGQDIFERRQREGIRPLQEAKKAPRPADGQGAFSDEKPAGARPGSGI